MDRVLTLRRAIAPAQLGTIEARWRELTTSAMPAFVYAPGTEPPEPPDTLPKRRATDNQSMECAA